MKTGSVMAWSLITLAGCATVDSSTTVEVAKTGAPASNDLPASPEWSAPTERIAIGGGAPLGGRLKVGFIGLADAERARLATISDRLDIVNFADGAAALAAMSTLDGVVGGAFCKPEFLRAGSRLRWLQVTSAGVDDCAYLIEMKAATGLVLTNMRTTHAPNIADHAFALLLTLTRNMHAYHNLQRDAQWKRASNTEARELQGGTAVVVGLGGIGTQIARRAFGFGMTVLAVDPKDIEKPSYVSALVKPQGLDEVLRQADVVFIAAPLTPETQNLFDSRRFTILKPGALLINVSRGRIVNTTALMDALESGQLSGAGLDVVDPEPLPPEHPLWGMPNVVLTPHMANESPGRRPRQDVILEQNLRAFGAGEPLRNVVNKIVGY
ncbi:MAG: D-2-hydroxyacid dehydrogenase [Deltaproteobacteria bacterium]|nr:D-2-hydroxyacid dehydrogenase [Deltaproteobacteria bacterium]